MRETYQVALLGLYRGYWWYISSLPYERAVMQRGASPNSSGDLNSSICLQDKFYQKEMWAQQKHIITKHRFRMNNNPIRCFLIAQEFFMQKILSFFKIEKQIEKIYHFNPLCPPCPARHKGRNSKSIYQVCFKYLYYRRSSILFVGRNSAFWRKGYTVVLFDERAIL